MSGLYRFDHLLTEAGWQSPGWLEVDRNGDILSLEPAASNAEAVSGYAVPGMPNLHCHAFQRALAGLAEHGGPGQDSFWTWREAMYRFVARVTPDDLEAIATQLYLEMLKAGYTSVVEFHYLHHAPDGGAYSDVAEMSKRILQAARHVGIGLTHLPVLYTAGGFGGEPAGDLQRRFVNEVDGLLTIIAELRKEAKSDPQIQLGLAPHSLRAVAPEGLDAAVSGMTRIDSGAPIHIHIAEQRREVEECVAWSGKRPVEWLLSNIDIDGRWCLVHATHLTDREIEGIAENGAIVGLCPTTEANLGDGVFRLREFLDRNGRFGVGSDSNVSVSPVEELRWLEYGQRLQSGQRNIAGDENQSTGTLLYRSAAAGGAGATGRPVGAIAVGKRADLVVLDPAQPIFAGRDRARVLDSYVFSGNANPVRDVMVGGRWTVRDGRAAGIDEEAIASAYRSALERLV